MIIYRQILSCVKTKSDLNFMELYMKIKRERATGKLALVKQKFCENKIGGEIASENSLTGDDFLLSPQNAAKYLDVSVKFIYELIQSGRISSYQVGGRLRRIRKRTLDNWLNLQAMKFER